MTRCPPGEGDDLQVDQVGALFTYLQHGLECGEVWVGDVDMGAHMLDAMGGEGLYGFWPGPWCLPG